MHKTSTNSIDQQQQQPQKLSKSQSQSSILNLFKSHFSSPFLIKKFRSKSRDKTAPTTTKEVLKPQQIINESSEQNIKPKKLTLSKIKSTSKKQQQIIQQQQPQIKQQPLLIINNEFQQKENISPSIYIKKQQQQQQQSSLTIKLSDDDNNNIMYNKQLKSSSSSSTTSSSSLIPQQLDTQESKQQDQIKTSSSSSSSSSTSSSSRHLSYLQLSCLINGYDTSYTSQNALSVNTISPSSLLSTSSSLISPPKIKNSLKSQLKVFNKKSDTKSSPQPPKNEEIDEKILTPVKIEIEIIEEKQQQQAKSADLNVDVINKSPISRVSYCLVILSF
jgi:hypothetical protein